MGLGVCGLGDLIGKKERQGKKTKDGYVCTNVDQRM